MADISHLSNLQATEPLEWEGYVESKESQGPPPAGTYILQAPDRFSKEAFTETRKGTLQAAVDPTIMGPERAGLVLKFTRVSSTVYQRGSGKSSQLQDYLAACGLKGIPIGTDQEKADAVEQTAGTVYQAVLDWEAYFKNKSTGQVFNLKGMSKFPRKDDGTPDPWVLVPGEVGDDGKPLKIRAQVRVVRFIPAAA